MASKLRQLLASLRRRRDPEVDFERRERDRLSAEYTGSLTRNPGQEYGIKPPK
jgi:hypothetical protein